MGSGIELIRMTIYVFFPVALFYYFNRPEFQRKALEEKKKVLYPEGNLPPLSIDEVRALRLKLRQERKQQQLVEQQQQEAMSSEPSTTAQHTPQYRT